MKKPAKHQTVRRCSQKRDGSWLVVTHCGQSATAPQAVPEGSQISIRDGQVERHSSWQ